MKYKTSKNQNGCFVVESTFVQYSSLELYLSMSPVSVFNYFLRLNKILMIMMTMMKCFFFFFNKFYFFFFIFSFNFI